MPRRVMCMLSSPGRSIQHGRLSPRSSGPDLPSTEKFAVGDTQAPSLPTPQPPAPHRLGFQSPPASCCSAPRHTGDEAGLLWASPAFRGHVGAAQRWLSWIRLWRRRCIHPHPGAKILRRTHTPPPRNACIPPGCIHLAQERSHRPGGASMLHRAPASPLGVHPRPREVPASRPEPDPSRSWRIPGASPAHPALPRRPGAACGSILSSHGGNPAPTAPPDGCEEPNAS